MSVTEFKVEGKRAGENDGRMGQIQRGARNVSYSLRFGSALVVDVEAVLKAVKIRLNAEGGEKKAKG